MKPLEYYILASLALVCLAVMPARAETFSPQTACSGERLVVLGDSLVAGYGLGPGQGFPEQLSKALEARNINITVVNAGVSGDTTSSGLSRLDWSVSDDADAVLLELGANDALRGIAPEVTEKNLEAMIVRLKERGIKVMLAGMMAPPNMGSAYGKAFNGIYERLAQKHSLVLYPFFLEGVAADPALNQADGIHPTQEGISVIVEKIQPELETFLKELCVKGAS